MASVNVIVQGSGQRLQHGSSRCLTSQAYSLAKRRRACIHASTALETPLAGDAPGGAVVSPLIGKKLLQLNPQQCAVPLLHPIAHQLPFATSLQVYSSSSGRSSSRDVPPGRSNVQAQPQANNSLVELHYVISGRGHFTSSSTGAQQELWPGDSVIALHGAASFAAGPVPPAADAPQHTDLQKQLLQQPQQHQQQHQQQQPQQQPVTAAWAQLSSWLQQLHAKQHPVASSSSQVQQGAPQHAAAAAAAAAHNGNGNSNDNGSSKGSSQLVMLQLLLPAELLTGELLTHHEGHCHAVAAQLPWTIGSSSSSSELRQHAYSSGHSQQCVATPLSSIREAEVCGLLADAGVAPPSTHGDRQQQQQSRAEADQQTAQQPSAAGSSGSSHLSSSTSGSDSSSGSSHLSSSTSGSDSGTSSRRGGGQAAHTTTSSSSSSSTAALLPSLNQQQILKRALSEVGAFRLPQQTNRLALLFGPHSSPPVSVSFGVEVFEPGHVTPLHIHNTAHELFFVLAGKGEAVFKPRGSSNGGSSAGSSSGGGSSAGSSSSSSAQRVTVSPGDVAVFSPGVVHGVDNPSDSQLYCLQMMLPNEFFVEWVRSGEEAGSLDVAAVQQLAAAASCG